MERLLEAKKIEVINEGPPSKPRSRIAEVEEQESEASTDPSTDPSTNLPPTSTGLSPLSPLVPPSGGGRGQAGFENPPLATAGEDRKETCEEEGTKEKIMCVPVAPGIVELRHPEVTSAPLTAWEMDELKARGFAPDDLFAMNPERARAILADPGRNHLTERYGKGADAPPDTVCRVCGEPGARYFSEPLGPGERPDRFPLATALHLECCPKYFEGGALNEHGAPNNGRE